MRIAFVTDTYEDGIGGGVVTGVRFVEALRRRHEVTVVAAGAAAPGKVVLPGFEIPLRAMRESRFVFAWPSRAELERVFAEVDVVHVQFPFLLGLAALRLAPRMQVATVAAFHVQPENLLMNLRLHARWVSHWLYRRWTRNFFQRADAVVCPSQFAVDRLRQFGLTTPAWVVSNGVPPNRPRGTLRTGIRPAGRPYLLLCTGRLARDKRQDVIIDAVARCRHRAQIRLVIAGAGPLEQALRERARRCGLTVELGYVSDARLVQLLREADLFVHASEVELEGMSILEAQAAGLPVLVADAPESAARYLAPGADYLFRPGDPADLALHLDHLLDTPGALAVGSRDSLERSASYDFHRSVRTLEQVYAMAMAAADERYRGARRFASNRQAFARRPLPVVRRAP